VRNFRIVIAGHGTLPASLLATAELICGQIPDAAAAGLAPSESPDNYAEELRAVIGTEGEADVLVLCDLLGGTPYNVAAAVAGRSARIVCIAGVNLTMLIEAALAVEPLADPLVEKLLEAARSGIDESVRHRAGRVS
jgi:mannose/fructose-specific phosphotransferase system component IIA